MRKVVLGFSGGLDTSYCTKYLSVDYDVIAVTVNTGGFDRTEKNELKEKARSLGASEFHFLEATDEFYSGGIKYLLFGNVLKNNVYPLSVSAERIFQASKIADFAKKINSEAIAHGSTGAGNDQIRFDSIFQSIHPDAEIITPIRDQGLSRETEISYLKEHGVESDWKKAVYSINKGLWGTSVGGKETLTSHLPLPEEAFTQQISKNKPVEITIEFEKGEPVALDGKNTGPVKVIEYLNKLGSSFGIGRDIHVGDTIIGIKGRVGFEAPGAAVLIKAHHTLEKHVLSKQQLFIKDQLAAWYGQMMHDGQFLDPVMRDIEQFLVSSQSSVTGTVRIKLLPYTFQVLGIESPYDLMQSDFGKYGEENSAWTSDDARGFAKIYSNQLKIYHKVHHE